jgi:parvulin-like peptidyl-prolyl isomerase
MNPDIVDVRKRRTTGRGWQPPALVGRGWLVFLGLVLVLALAGCSNGAEPTRSAAQGTDGQETVATEAAPQQTAAPSPTAELPPTATPTPPAPLAAMVNGEYIFLADYERRVQQYEQALLDQGTDPDTAEGQELLAQSRVDVLEGMVDSVLIEQGGASLGLVLGEEELEAQLVADIEAGGGQAAFDEWLQATGQTRDDYKEMLRQSMLAQRVMEVVTEGVPTEAEQVHARHIVVESEEAGEGILAALEAGADFVALARQHSLDLATRDNGGDLGWFSRGLVAPELENAAFGLQPGQVSEPIHLGEGYHIVQVVEREAARPLSLEMQMDLQRATFEQWLEELRTAAEINRYVQD